MSKSIKSNSQHSVRKREFLARLVERYNEPVRDRMIPIPESLHQNMKNVGVKHNMSIYEAYVDAARLWLKRKGVSMDLEGLGGITPEEEIMLSEILAIMRNKNHSKIFEQTLVAIRLLMQSAQSK